MYATPADLRTEGITVAMAADDRLRTLVEEAGGLIDRVTGWFFEPRTTTIRLDGRGTPSLEPPVPPIRLDRLAIHDHDVALSEAVDVIGAPVGPGFDAPRLTLRRGRCFPRGTGNVVAAGRWGFTESDGTAEGRTPLEIRRACILLVLRGIDPLAGAASSDARNRWRLLEERTRDQSYRLAELRVGPPPDRRSGDRRDPRPLSPTDRPGSRVMRGRLIFPFLAELARLDTLGTAAADPAGAGPAASGYDPDFKEPVLIDEDDDGIGERRRCELPPVRLPCQVEPDAFDAMRMLATGNAPRSQIELVFHFADLEREGLVDTATGDALVRPGDRLVAIFDRAGALVQAIRTPPGLYATEARPSGFGLDLARPRRNLLLVRFADRPQATARTA